MEWLDPWWSTECMDAKFHDTFAGELQLEVAPGHELFGLPTRVIGRRSDCDYALFELLDGTGRVAYVHLTWIQKQDKPPFPASAIFPSLESWAENVMIPQHREYSEDV